MSLGNGRKKTNLRQEPIFQKNKPNHPFGINDVFPNDSGVVNNIVDVAAFPVCISPKSYYDSGAQGWDQVNKNHPYGKICLFAIQLLTQCIEDDEIGTPMIKVARTDPLYPRIVAAFIRRATSTPSLPGDDNLIKDYMIPSKHFDPFLAQLIINERSHIVDHPEEEEAEAEEAPPGGGGGGGRGGGGRNRGRKRKKKVDEIAKRVRKYLEEAREEGVQYEPPIDKVIPLVVRFPDDNSMDLEEDGLYSTVYGDNGGGGGRKYVGGVVFFLIMDPNWNMGKAMQKVLDNADARNRHRYATNGGTATSRGGGGGGGRYGSGAFKEAYPHLYDQPDHAVFNITRTEYRRLAGMIHNDPDLATRRYMPNVTSFLDPNGEPNPYHPLNMFTPKWALSMMLHVMSAEVVDPRRCNVEMYSITNGGDDMELSSWRFPPYDTYYYPVDTWFWYRPNRAGISQQYFPWIEIPDALREAQFYSTTSNGDYLCIADEFERGTTLGGLGLVPIVPITTIDWDPFDHKKNNPINDFRMTHAIIFDAIRATKPKKPRGRNASNPALMARWAEEYDRYTAEIWKMRRACLLTASQLFIPNDHVTREFRACLEFIHSLPNNKRMGSYVPTLIENMDTLGCYLVRIGYIVKHDRTIMQEIRHWILVKYGSWCTYRWYETSMHVNIMFHGLSQSGKSYFNVDALDKTSIPDTITSMLETSNRAFNTHDDVLDKVIRKDEVEDFYVSRKAAENDRTGRAERTKSMLTDLKCTYSVLTFVESPNGLKKRVAEHLETIFHATMFCNTNKKINAGEEALASRFLQFTIARPKESLARLRGAKDRYSPADTQATRDQVQHWCVMQALVAIVSKLQDMLLVSKVSMDVFDMITIRMSDYLRYKGIDTEQIRHFIMMERLARVFTIVDALNNIYNVAGARFYGERFSVEQLLHIDPYLYCTKQATLWVWTATSEMIIDPMRQVTIRAALFNAHINTQRDKDFNYSLGEILKHDRCITWKQCVKPGQQQQQQQQQQAFESGGGAAHEVPNRYFDFNYVRIPGNFQDTVAKIARETRPRIGANEVEGHLKALCRDYISVRPYKKYPVKSYNEARQKDNNNGQTTMGVFFEPSVEDYTEKLQIVQIDTQLNEVCIAVEALNHYNEYVIWEAFMTCIHDNFRPQVFLTGNQVKDHPGLFETIGIDAKTIAEENGGECFALSNQTWITKNAKVMMRDFLFSNAEDTGEMGYDVSESERMDEFIRIYEDLDDWGCGKHHDRVAIPGPIEQNPAKRTTIAARIAYAKVNDPRFVVLERRCATPEKIRAYNEYPQSFIDDENAQLTNRHAVHKFDNSELNRKRLPVTRLKRRRVVTQQYPPLPLLIAPPPTAATAFDCGDNTLDLPHMDQLTIDEQPVSSTRFDETANTSVTIH